MYYENFDSSLLAFFADVVVKITLLLLACSLFDVFAKNCSAALRHRTWATAMVAVLILPVISFVAPDYRLAILPADWSNQTLSSESPSTYSLEVATAIATVPGVQSEPYAKASSPMSQPEEPGMISFGIPNANASEGTAGEFVQAKPEITSHTGLYKNRCSSAPWFQPTATVAWVWLAGFVLTISPLLFGIGRVLWLRRESPAILEAEPSNLTSS